MNEKIPANVIKGKPDFYFEYTMPSLDWYEIVKVTIKPDDYYYFELERRYDNTWYLIGINYPGYPAYSTEVEKKELGRLDPYYLVRFIDWCKVEDWRGSRIIHIKMLSGEFNIFDEIKKLMDLKKEYDEKQEKYRKVEE